MQNYLQSSRRRKNAARISAVLLSVTAAAGVLIAVKTDKTPLKGHSVGDVSNEYRHVGNDFDLGGKINDVSGNDDSKMNNFDIGVAKNASLKTDNALFEDFSDKKVRVLFQNGNVRELPLEEYINGCVFGEMPLNFESQALMAQSVAVRSFTVRQMTCGTSKHKSADVCTNPACCQNYVSTEKLSESDRKRLADAVNATKGLIMTYDGLPIEAVYHASSGSETLDSEDVWGGRVEYLRSVKAPDGEEAISVSGMGHRVGMSQHGANLFAKEGMNYIDILKYYYRGISFDFLK